MSDLPRKRIELSFNEAELTCIKAALFRYLREVPKGTPRLRAQRLAEIIKGTLCTFDPDYPYEEDTAPTKKTKRKTKRDISRRDTEELARGNFSQPNEEEENSQFMAVLRTLM